MISRKALIRAERAVETYDENGLGENRTKKGVGTKYQDGVPYMLQGYLKDHTSGMTMNEVAALFHATPRAVNNWMNRYPEFKSALIECRAVVDDIVVSA